MLNQLLAASGWFLDLAFFLLLILGTALGSYRGFIREVCKVAGKWASLIIAFLFCVSFANFLESVFHMTSAITSGLASAIAKRGAYGVALTTDVAGAEISEALAQIGIGAFPRWIISLSFSKVDLIPSGTTAATLIASVLAKWISVIIAFILLIIFIRVVVRLIANVFGSIKDNIPPLRILDQLLGALLGFSKALFLIFVLLLLCKWLPLNALHEFIQSSNIVGRIFTSDWFHNATSYAISGEWFTKYLNK